jgi:hypothetical protein
VQQIIDIHYVLKYVAIRFEAHCSIAIYKWLAVTFVSFEVDALMNIKKNNVL